jgi:hypothetical protein
MKSLVYRPSFYWASVVGLEWITSLEVACSYLGIIAISILVWLWCNLMFISGSSLLCSKQCFVKMPKTFVSEKILIPSLTILTVFITKRCFGKMSFRIRLFKMVITVLLNVFLTPTLWYIKFRHSKRGPIWRLVYMKF